jgi:peptidoglycan hydrolase-like protein with peptidoglycan-binding domain
MRPRDLPLPRRARRRALWGLAAFVMVALLGLVAAVLAWSGVTLAADATALARVEAQPFGGTLERVRAFGPNGRRIPLSVRGGRLTPRTRLTPGELVSVEIVVRRSRWLGWALGDTHHERLTLRAPVARVGERWLTVPARSAVRVIFDRSVSAVGYGSRGHLRRRTLDGVRRSLALALGRRAAAGTVEVAAAARPWERLGSPVAVSWFPPASRPVAVSSPAPGARLAPTAPIRLTFSKPVAGVLAGDRPRLSPSTPGRWRQTDSHTLVFVPSGFGARFASELRVELPRVVAVTGSSGNGLHTTRRIGWTVPPGSILRLQQLLAQAGYLPLDWQPSGAPMARTLAAEVGAAVDPPQGRFSWRYPSTPGELRALWSEGSPNQITRGAVMMFQDSHGLDVDALPGAMVWHALIADAIAGKRREGGYSYVYVHSSLPQSLTLWHNGRTVLSSPGNTGVPAAPTQLGTFPVFEHIPVGTMSGTNPDGSHYDDPGIRYISYFNGGDAIHAFNRASFGTPQSLGCVELPLASAAKVWPYTPIGTLVTIEN